jgi:murein DD-endopeptidase MepM/ murein hydrolase activator NlpD
MPIIPFFAEDASGEIKPFILTFTLFPTTTNYMGMLKDFFTSKEKLLFIGIGYGLLFLLLVFQVLVNVIPWLGDTSAPFVAISGLKPELSFRDTVWLRVTARDEQTAVGSIGMFVDGNLIDRWNGDTKRVSEVFAFDSRELPEGPHELLIQTADTSLFGHIRSRRYEITVDRTPPVLSLLPASTNTFQGDTLAVYIKAGEKLHDLEAVFLGKTYTFFSREGGEPVYRALIGIPVLQPAKAFPLTLHATDLAGNSSELGLDVRLLQKGFHKEAITLTPTKAGLLTDYVAIREDYRKIRAAFAVLSKRQLWRQGFIRPADGRVTSDFGEQRVFNTKVYSVHGGIDIANKAGTPVHASNAGIVLLAERLHLFGNAVIIDHGQGVHTMYAHMRKLEVTKNQKVVKGQLIGLMGDTGLTTGPHVHWEMRVHGVVVNPTQWITQAFDYP